jgi:hypothetical protein
LNRGIKYYSWLPQWIARHFIGRDYAGCNPSWRVVGRYTLHIMLERFFIALELIEGYRGSLTNVLLTDSRDVVLQEDPFGQLGGNLVSGLEENTIGQCSVNSNWMKHVYGNGVLANMSKYRIVCAGVTVGPVDAMHEYLVQMCGEIWKCLPRIAGYPCYDQTIHNYLIYTHRVALELTDNRAGIIGTLHSVDRRDIRVDASSGAVTVQGKPPAILHQYDRHASVADFVVERLNKNVRTSPRLPTVGTIPA